MAISPWNMSATLPSPDGRWVAEIDEAHEVGMSAPTSGTLRVGIGSGKRKPGFEPSCLWLYKGM